MSYAFLEKVGYYKTKAAIKHHFFCKRLVKEDLKRKQDTLAAIDALPAGLLPLRSSDKPEVVVSLTSYGIRAKESLPYTLYSLMTQTHMPDRIVVWLDNIHFSDPALTPPLRRLKEVGIEFNYVEDIRSYKKLIPALKKYPDDIIITVDDDWYYNPKTVEWLLDDYVRSDKQTVLGTWGYRPNFSDGEFTPYSTWSIEDGTEREDVSLIGCGGILYPPHVFDEEILKADLFTRLAPTADDLWFWVMEKRLGIKSRLSTIHGYGLHTAIDRISIYEPNTPGSLYFINEVNGQNDIQLRKLIEYYRIEP